MVKMSVAATTHGVEAADILCGIAGRLADAGVESARLDSRLLLAEALGRADAVLPHERLERMDGESGARLERLVTRRARGEPVSRIRGWRDFWSVRLGLNDDTLDPRPDSETLVDAVMEWTEGRRDAAHRVLDLGTGSGALLIACLCELGNARGLGIDVSPGAVSMASQNASRNGVGERCAFEVASFGEMAARGEGAFDVIVCNPPYVPTGEIDGLAREVAGHDPRRALDGGADGMGCWREVLPAIAGNLAPGGRAMVEIGAGQEDGVAALARAAGLELAASRADLAGITRCLVFGAAAKGRAGPNR